MLFIDRTTNNNLDQQIIRLYWKRHSHPLSDLSLSQQLHRILHETSFGYSWPEFNTRIDQVVTILF